MQVPLEANSNKCQALRLNLNEGGSCEDEEFCNHLVFGANLMRREGFQCMQRRS